MAEKSIEEKARKIASQRPEAGKEFEQMQAAQNQLLEIQAAQKQNLMERRVMANSQAEQNQVLAQAAEVGAQSVAAGNMQLNQATQQTMGRYGLSQPKTTSQVKQRQSEVVTKQNVTIHNNTTNITNNTVPANIGGPIQGRPIQFKQPDADGGMGRFKNWLQQTFARQEDAAKKRDREYQRRETALTKSSNKMMRKIEDFSKDITKKLDPRNVGKTIGGQLKTILGILGIGLIAKNFNKLLDWIFGAQNKVENEYIPSIKNFFAWVKGDKDAKQPGLITKLTEGITNTFGKLFFGKDFDGSKGNVFKDKGLLKGMRDYLWNDTSGNDRGVLNILFDKIKDGLKERSAMAKNAITLDKSATVWDIIKNPGEAFKEFLTNLTNYFGVLVGGESYLRKIQGDVVSRSTVAKNRTDPDKESKRYEKREHVTVGGKKYSTHKGDTALLEFQSGKYGKTDQFKISSHYMNEKGELLSGSAGAILAASNNATYHKYSAEYLSEVNSAALANDLSFLYSEAKKSEDENKGPILINRDIFRMANQDPELKKVVEKHVRKAKDGEWCIVLRERSVEDIEKEIKELTPDWYKVSSKLQQHKAGGLAWGVGNVLALLRGMSGPKAWIEDIRDFIKLQDVPLYTQVIIKSGDKQEGDIFVRSLSGDELLKLGYIAADSEAIKQAAYGFMTADDRKNLSGDNLNLNTQDKSFVLALQNGLDHMMKNRKPGEGDYDYDARHMADNKQPTSSGSSSSTSSPSSSETTDVTYTSNVSEDSGDQPSSNANFESSSEQTVSGTGLIYGPSGPFDPNAAAEWITANASQDCLGGGDGVKGITGWCGRWVRQALVNGGMYGSSLNEKGGPNGGDFKPVLESLGWKEISQKGPFQPGDVMVLQNASNGGGGSYGHVAMFTGTGNGRSGWFSDFDQANAVSAYGKKLGDKGVSVLRYGVDYTGPKTGTPGHFWKKMPNENIFNYSVDTRRGTESPESYIQRNYNARKHKWPKWATAEKLLEFYNKGRNWAVNAVRKAIGAVANTFSGEVTSTASSEATTGGEVPMESSSESQDRSFSGFFSDAKDIVKRAWGSLSHKASEGAQWVMNKAGDAVDWEASLHGGTSYTGGGYPKSATERYLYAKYTGKDVGNYAIPESIRGGSTLQRDEWWAKFFDKEGNLKIKDSDNVNPTLVKYLHEIEGELKKGNDLDEYHLKIAAQGLDAEMVHNASETRDQQRVISALVSRNSDTAMAQSFTNE